MTLRNGMQHPVPARARLRFHPNGRFACCVHELVSQVEVLEWDAQKGTLHSVQKISLVPEDYHGTTRGADIVFTRDGALCLCGES